MKFDLPPPIPPKRKGPPIPDPLPVPGREVVAPAEQAARTPALPIVPPPLPFTQEARSPALSQAPAKAKSQESSSLSAAFIGCLIALVVGAFVVIAALADLSSDTPVNNARETSVSPSPTPPLIPEKASTAPAPESSPLADNPATPEPTPYLFVGISAQVVATPQPTTTPDKFSGYAESLRQSTLAASTPIPQLYRVVGIANGDYLNMRRGPSATSAIVHRLQDDVTGIILIGERVNNGQTIWQQINCAGYVGWVNIDFLSPYGEGSSPSNSGPTSSAQSYPTATPFVSTAIVSWAGQSYTVDSRHAAAINAKITRAQEYVARYIALKGDQSNLQLKLSKSGPFGKKRLSDALAATTAELKKTQRDGDAIIADMLQLIKQAQIR